MRKLQEYLLGGLTARQRSKIDQRIIADESFFQELLAAEDALTNDFVRGLLPSDVALRIATIAQASPEWTRKVDFARATQILLQRNAQQAERKGAALAEAVYDELKALATTHLARERKSALSPTDLVNEVYLALGVKAIPAVASRAEFLAMAGSAMRRVLVDIARKERAISRGGPRHDFEGSAGANLNDAMNNEDRVLALDQALAALAGIDPRQSRLVELKFFSGLTNDEIADILGVSPRTVKREWGIARARLHSYLSASQTIQ